MALTAGQKAAIRKSHPSCYVCEALGVPNSDFAGYEQTAVHYDHWLAQGLVGDKQADLDANIRPIHAASDGADPLQKNWDRAGRRNCHRGKSHKYTGQEWCDYIRIYRLATETNYSDDLMANRNRKDPAYDVSIKWDAKKQTVEFRGGIYPLMLQQVGPNKEEWQSFSTLVPPTLLWTDEAVQSREAETKRLAEFAWHLRSNPLLTTILCRWADGRLKVFDGNHRLCAYILARGNDPVPVTIFDGPNPSRFLSVAADAHDQLTQLKYQYTDKALKFSALYKDELIQAQKEYGANASEELAWHGLSRSSVQVRILGRLTSNLDDAGGWRLKWRALGLTDPSWNEFVRTYARVSPETEPFESPFYLREAEVDNLITLCTCFDEELFERHPEASASYKTKWWKLGHARFAKALGQVVKHSMKLPNTPEFPAYTPVWSDYILGVVRQGVVNWRESPAWRGPTTANNEPDVSRTLTERGFTEAALIA
jgi:hypothetical protein